jgi:hypothetical protein
MELIDYLSLELTLINNKTNTSFPLGNCTRLNLETFLNTEFTDPQWDEFQKIMQEFRDSASNLHVFLSCIGAK